MSAAQHRRINSPGAVKKRSRVRQRRQGRITDPAAFHLQIKKTGDSDFIHRLKSKIIKIVNTGPAELKGSRIITDGDVSLLKDVKYNKHTFLETLLKSFPTTHIVPEETYTITFPEIAIADLFTYPSKAKAAVIQLLCGAFHFPVHNGRFAQADDLVIPLNEKTFGGGTLELPLEAKDDHLLALSMGVSFLTSDNQRIGDRRFYAGGIIEAVTLREGKIQPFQYPEASRAIGKVVKKE